MSYGYTLLSETFPVARKQHRCIWCGEAIPVGMKHRHEKSVYYGNMQDFRWHDECVKAQQDDIRETGECEFAAYENERPTPGVMASPMGSVPCPDEDACIRAGKCLERCGQPDEARRTAGVTVPGHQTFSQQTPTGSGEAGP